MDGNTTEESGSPKDDHQWLQTMRERHNRNMKAMSGKRVERLRKSVERKVLKAIEETSSILRVEWFIEGEHNKEMEENLEEEDAKVSVCATRFE